MANMSYCRFRNTLNDLEDCFENMENTLEVGIDNEEINAREKLIELCQEIVYKYNDFDFKDTIEE